VDEGNCAHLALVHVEDERVREDEVDVVGELVDRLVVPAFELLLQNRDREEEQVWVSRDGQCVA
jgi:hypothetical protein